MIRQRLERFLQKHPDVKVSDIAYDQNISPATVYRLLNGHNVNRSTIAAVERFLKKYESREALQPTGT